MKVMIVDDNPKIRETIRICIGSLAAEVVECSDGSDVMVLYSKHHPDVVLMDIRMDRMDGITAAENLRAVFPGSRVIFVTEYFDSKHRKLAEQTGACGFISKENLLELTMLIKKTVAQDTL